jgi:hypoxia up-regulated 1
MEDVKDFLGLGKKDQKVLKDESSSSSSSSSKSSTSSETVKASAKASSKPKDDTKTPPKPEAKPTPKMKTETMKFEFNAQHDPIAVIPFPEHKFMAERLVFLGNVGQANMSRIRAFDKSDSNRLAREEDLNNLESKIYRIRDQLDDTEFTSFASAPMIKDVQRLVKSTSQWLSDSAQDATSEVLRERRKALEEIMAPIALRRDEAAKRPELTKLLGDALTQAKGLVTLIEDSLNVAAKKSSEMAESSSSAAAEASSAADPLADLEQTESGATPQPTDTPLSFLPVYTADDLKVVKSSYESTNRWFEEKLAQQEKLLPYEDAVFTSSELEAKAKELNDGLMKLLQQKFKATENAAKAQEKAEKAKKAQEKKEKADKKKAEKKAKEESKATESQTEKTSTSKTKEAASASSGKDEL